MAEQKPDIPKSLIEAFDKSKLKKTNTRITTEGGGEIIETKDEHGRFTQKRTDKHGYGFVVETHGDLQVGEIMDGLIMGSQDVAIELDVLRKHKVTHILNLATFVKNQFPDEFVYKNLNVMDYIDRNCLKFFDEAFIFIGQGMREGCVYIHCNAGVSRASTFTIGYLMKTKGMTFEEAHDLVKSKRPCIRPNDGSQDVAMEYDLLQKYKVTHILNLATFVENQFPSKFTYRKMHINDYPEANILGMFNTAFGFIDKARENGCVLVHCNAGVSRAATIVIGYLMKTKGMTYQQAFDYTKSKRPCICPNSGFRTQLATYEKMLKEESKCAKK
ncbi:hypothetical protein KUTeg_008362 [Tegillarca granosa]|uniref:Uncharacterized protein n=1 Tax=Tegillarca granosa TaxID=220873 RepID=A0ABQ9FB45_TEGGR|nr:hypothetical protein KUTeg_008362 [Tegillarca granosa]